MENALGLTRFNLELLGLSQYFYNCISRKVLCKCREDCKTIRKVFIYKFVILWVLDTNTETAIKFVFSCKMSQLSFPRVRGPNFFLSVIYSDSFDWTIFCLVFQFLRKPFFVSGCYSGFRLSLDLWMTLITKWCNLWMIFIKNDEF